MKLLISESEKNRILGMHNKVRNLLFEEMSEDVANWDEAKAWVSRQSGGHAGELTDIKYATYKNYQGNFVQIYNDGSVTEFTDDGDIIHSGTWSWNGTKVVFSWMKPEVSGWEEAKQYFIDTYDSDSSTGWAYDTQGVWNDYEWVRAKWVLNPDRTMEIKSDGTYKVKDFVSNDTKSAGKWSWDGSKIIFDLRSGMTKRAIGYFTEDDGPADDEGLKVAVFEKNKIGNIGAKGPVVKYIQYHVTPTNPDNPDEDFGTGARCGIDREKCNGVYGPRTKELVKQWQERHGVTADGIWGKETNRIFSDSGEDVEDKVD